MTAAPGEPVGDLARSGPTRDDPARPEPTGAHPTEPEPPLLTDGGLLALLVVDGVLLAVAGLGFTPMYAGGVPAPAGALLSILVLPWLVRRAAEVDSRQSRAAAPLSAWGLTLGVLGLAGPGGDVLLPATWPTLLLMFGGLVSGLWALRSVPDRWSPVRGDRARGGNTSG